MPIRQVPITAIMTAELTAAFERTMSPERWRTYRFAAGFRQDLALGLYLWNAAIGQSFHFPLQAVEVALRNVIHTALSAKYGANWCFTDACRAMIGPRMVNDLEKAEQRHRKIYAQTPSTPQLLASLSLGFWVALLRRPYHVALWDGQIITAFPHLEPDKTLADVSKVGTAIQDLRNRIFHQEPLIGHNLSQHYGDILKMLGWICDDTRQWVRQHSSVPRVIRERPR
jgi:hypothetical protein